jgi:hypothetical protein
LNVRIAIREGHCLVTDSLFLTGGSVRPPAVYWSIGQMFSAEPSYFVNQNMVANALELVAGRPSLCRYLAHAGDLEVC